MINYPSEPRDFEEYGNTGLVGNLVAVFVKTILRNDVMPLVKQCTTDIQPNLNSIEKNVKEIMGKHSFMHIKFNKK